jgi:hypothetical protein
MVPSTKLSGFGNLLQKDVPTIRLKQADTKYNIKTHELIFLFYY